MRLCGLAIAVKNSRGQVIRESHYVTPHEGGKGAVRDAIEYVLREQGLLERIIDQYITAKPDAATKSRPKLAPCGTHIFLPDPGLPPSKSPAFSRSSASRDMLSRLQQLSSRRRLHRRRNLLSRDLERFIPTRANSGSLAVLVMRIRRESDGIRSSAFTGKAIAPNWDIELQTKKEPLRWTGASCASEGLAVVTRPFSGLLWR